MTRAMAREKIAVEPHKTRATTIGMSTAAVATRFQVMRRESPGFRGVHHITLREINHGGEWGGVGTDGSASNVLKRLLDDILEHHLCRHVSLSAFSSASNTSHLDADSTEGRWKTSRSIPRIAV